MSGVLALVGGGEFLDGCSFDRALAAVRDADEVVLIPAAAAYENPSRLVERAEAHFAAFGVGLRALDLYRRPDALDDDNVDAVRSAKFLYLAGGSSMHLVSVLKSSPVLDALVAAWEGGAVVAGSGAGADVLCDPMVDPRGGAFTVGLGLVQGLSVIPRANTWSDEAVHRTVQLAPADVVVAALPEQTALIRAADGRWSVDGVGRVDVYAAGVLTGLEALP